MQSKADRTQLHQHQDQWKIPTGQENNHQCHKIQDKSRNQIPISEKKRVASNVPIVAMH